ncbi:MAG: winged helix-turn-helix domain-containing protein [Alphaproteobacteria bacterium]
MKLNIRIDFDAERALGPGKIRLLELIGKLGSISAAGREMGMAYTRAWQLVEALNNVFDAPLVQAMHGGERGGGAKVTPLGQAVVRAYREFEADAVDMAAKRIERLARPAKAKARIRKRRPTDQSA